MTTTTGAAPMSAAEVLSGIDNLINHAASNCPKWSALAIKVKAAKKARNAVAAMAERQTETSQMLTASRCMVKRLSAQREALVKEFEALRAKATALCDALDSGADPRAAYLNLRAAIDAARTEARDG